MAKFTSETVPVPKDVFKNFLKLTEIPRGSGNIGAVSEYLQNWGKEKGLEVLTDTAGNVILRKQAAKGKEGLPSVLMQGHMDMVCTKASGVEFDFVKDPIKPYIEGDWITTMGKTTLGADNGIGIAMALAVLESGESFGPLEAIFTVDEETEMTGAINLQAGVLKSKYMINLDDEVDGKICVGSAGGIERTMTIPIATETVEVEQLQLKLHKLSGGHSGEQIDEGRGNALKWVARMLCGSGYPRISKFDGGNARNAIPSHCDFTVVMESNKLQEQIQSMFKKLKDEFSNLEKEVELDVKVLPKQKVEVLTEESSKKAMDFLLISPHGVQRLSPDDPSFVQTSISTSLASISDGKFKIGLLGRSSCETQVDLLHQNLEAIVSLVGGEHEFDAGTDFPPWQPSVENNKILDFVKKAFEKVYEKPAILYQVHAGLECGLFKQKYPGMQVVAIGPLIENPHAPTEKLYVPAVQRVYEMLKLSLKMFGEQA